MHRRPFARLWLIPLLVVLAGLAACAPAPTAPPLSTRAPTRPAGLTAAATDRPTPTLFPSLTPPPLRNRTPEPTPTPAPSLRQLTSGGCCAQPGWSPDGAQVWYVDRPDEVQPAGLWGVPVAGGPPVFIRSRLGLYAADGALLAYPESGQTYIERVATGERWTTPAAGRAIAFSPDSAWIAWQTASSTVNFDRRRVEIWVAQVDGGDARVVASLVGGGLNGWFPDSARLLVNGRAELDGESRLAAVEVATGLITDLAPAAHARGVTLSPAGGWLAYQIAFSGQPEQDGLWVQALGGAARRLELFGAYRWRAEGRLLVIPLEPTRGSQRLVEVDAVSGETRALTDPRHLSFRIAAGDWALAPDGRRLVFVNAADHNLWLIELPPAESGL